jgi:hypothetical protein
LNHSCLLFLYEGGGVFLGLPWSLRVSEAPIDLVTAAARGCMEALGRQSRGWEALAAVAGPHHGCRLRPRTAAGGRTLPGANA